MEEKDFSTRIIEIAKELQSVIEENIKDGKQCAVIILSSERIDDETSKNNIGIFGSGGQARNVLHDFATQPNTKDVFFDVAKLVALQNFFKK